MIHYETRCYCDATCNSRLESDCCPDAIHICTVHPVTKLIDQTEAHLKGDVKTEEYSNSKKSNQNF